MTIDTSPKAASESFYESVSAAGFEAGLYSYSKAGFKIILYSSSFTFGLGKS